MEIIYSKLISGTVKYAFAEIDKKVADLKYNGVMVIDFGIVDPKSHTSDLVIYNLTKYARKREVSGYPQVYRRKDL